MPVPPVIQMYRYVMGSGGGLGNLLKASEEFQQTVDWVRYPTNSQTPTVSADSRPDPNGGTTADQVGFTANTGARLMQTVTLKASTQYTFSVHARAVSGTVDFRMRNITLKASVQKTATTTGPLTNGFTRFTYTFTTGAAGSYELALQNAAGTPTARDVIFWGAMLNQGGTALDYEYAAPTTGGSAPAPAYAGFGDSFGGVTAYYSLRQFTEAETLNAIRVRRSSDDTEQDIGFDSNGDLDSTALLAFVNESGNAYTSDFTSTEDLFEANGTGAAAQSVGGVDDAYKFTLSGGSNSHFSGLANFIDTGANVSISFDYYIPSTNSKVDTIGLYSCSPTLSETQIDQWASVSNFETTLNSDDFYFFARKGTDPVSTLDADGDVFYLKNIVVTQTDADGAVTTFYDQTGNGNDATNSTASEQPLVVSGGSVVTENGKAAIEFDSNWLTTTYSLPSTFSTFSVAKSNLARTYESLMGSDDTFNDWIWHLFRNDKFMLRPDSGSYYEGSILSAQQYLIDVIYNGDLNAHIDGSSYISQSSVSLPSPFGNLQIGTVDTNPTYTLDGRIQEIVVFDSDQSSNRTDMETNINDHFDIYT